MKIAGDYELERLSECRWRIPRKGKMRVDGMVYADASMVEELKKDQSLQQVANVATLPGIVKHSIGMPDIHWGYGFPIGGVAAFDEAEGGVISPGGVGYDINCGVRLLRTDLAADDLRPRMNELVAALFHSVPSGVGSTRKDVRLTHEHFRDVMREGASWAVGRGLGVAEDLEFIEEHGRIAGADPGEVSLRAVERGHDQIGTIGSGNHFVEVGWVSEVYDPAGAKAIGLAPGQVTVIVHTGSRGFGHQICDDYLKRMVRAAERYGIELPDRQLCCAPLGSSEAKSYFGAMACAANFAFANRQIITHFCREAFAQTLGGNPELRVVYDVCHNIAKFEDHLVDGKWRRLCVHRKGATRAMPPGHAKTPAPYREVGQPVLIPGDMGRYSYVLLGTDEAFRETFGSSCHGAGRQMSRKKASEAARGRNIKKEMAAQGIVVMAASRATLDEEISEAYKDVAEVVDVVHQAGIGRKVARLTPLGAIKG
jgi:tRNA-splicing ligase RtcB